MICHLQDDETIGADMGATQSKFLEVHNDYIRKVQEYDTLYGEHARISQVNMTFVSALIIFTMVYAVALCPSACPSIHLSVTSQEFY